MEVIAAATAAVKLGLAVIAAVVAVTVSACEEDRWGNVGGPNS